MAAKRTPRVYALTGAETLLAREKIAELKSLAGADGTDAYDFEEVDGASLSASAVLDTVATVPFLAPRRLVIVSRADKIKDAEATRLAQSFEKLPETSLLVFVFDPQEDERRVPAAEKTIVAAADQVVKCVAPAASAFIVELQKRAEKLGSRLDRGAASKLAEMTSHNLTDAIAELEKCALYANTSPITGDIVVMVAAPSQEWEVFKMLDAISAGNLGTALENLRRLVRDSGRIEEAAVRSLFPMIHRQLRLLWQARACIDANQSPAKAEGILVKRHNLAAANEYARSRVLDTARRLPIDVIAAMLRALSDADLRLKGQLPAAFPKETVERMVVEMCETAAVLR
jgi:DNA polymerase-3 subunit delta